MSTNTGYSLAMGDIAVLASTLSVLPRLNGIEVIKWKTDKMYDLMCWWKTMPYSTANYV
jgi:hypothetical protein